MEHIHFVKRHQVEDPENIFLGLEVSGDVQHEASIPKTRGILYVNGWNKDLLLNAFQIHTPTARIECRKDARSGGGRNHNFFLAHGKAIRFPTCQVGGLEAYPTSGRLRICVYFLPEQALKFGAQ